ncbi:MAG TPA: beta-galactosidase [Sphingomonas sp.]|jgi:hypothetical protein
MIGWRGWAALALVAALAPASAQRRAVPGTARTAVADHRGVYVATGPLLNARRGIPEAVYAQPLGSGVYIRLVWTQIEPRPGAYDFSLLDAELARAVRAGRKVSLSVQAGARSPTWLADAGVGTVRLATRQGGANRICLPVAIPVPWDAGYQRAYARAMRAVADRIRATRGGWDAVRVVKLTGISRITEELRLPITAGANECADDPSAEWREAGYTPDRAVAAWTALSDGVARAFPGKLLGQDVIERNDFPATTGRGFDPSVKERIVAEGLRRYPRRFMVQWNALTVDGPLGETPLRAKARGAVLGWQTNAFRGLEGAGCNAERRGPPLACDARSYAALVLRGSGSGAEYLEVWARDALRFPDAVRAADAELRRGR